MKPILASIFPNASQSCQKANPQLLPHVLPRAKLAGNVGRKRGVMNRTEAEFALRLEAMKRNGEILRYEYEGMTLRWAGMRYTPDFVVFIHRAERSRCVEECDLTVLASVKLIEIKGGHIWDRDIVRFKGARAHWPEFSFEMHQKTKQGWKRIH